MKTKNPFLVKIISLAFFILYLTSCNKQDPFISTQLQGSNSNSTIVDLYQLSLSKDTSFIKIVEIDNELNNQTLSGFNPENTEQVQQLIGNLKSAKNKVDVQLAFSLNGITCSEKMIDLLIKEAALLNNVVQKYPNIQQLDKGSLNKLFFSAYQEVISEKENTSFRIMKDCADNCCKSYVNSISDCDDNLLIGTSVILKFCCS